MICISIISIYMHSNSSRRISMKRRMFRKLSIRMRRRKDICVNGGMTITLSYIKSWKIKMEMEMSQVLEMEIRGSKR